MARVTSWQAQQKRMERAAAQRRRELATYAKQQAQWAEQQRAQFMADTFENQIDFLLSMHKDCGPVWPWHEIVGRAPPPAPVRRDQRERTAQAMAAAYSPTVMERVLGGDKKRRAEFAAAVEVARRGDDTEFAHHQAEHRAQLEAHQWEQQAAAAVLRGDLAAYRTILEHLSPFAELSESGMSVTIDLVRADLVMLACVVADAEIVPKQEHKLTATGKVSSKALATGRYWEIYQDYVCGCALRAAREVFALLPVPRVVVNVAFAGIDRSTGHHRYTTILAVSMPRDAALPLNYAALDPSDSMKNFDHRMKFKRGNPPEEVAPITAGESFIRTTPTARRGR